MPNPTITFDDGIGSATITCPLPRFQNWTPDTTVVDDRQTALGTGITQSFFFRIDPSASFEVPMLKPADLALALRLKRLLLIGGTCTIHTEDLGTRIYTAMLKPGTEPSIEFSNRSQVEYTLKLQVLNTDPATDMLCEYE